MLGGTSLLRGVRVIVGEADANAVRGIGDLLEKLGCTSLPAQGRAVCHALARSRPDVALVDTALAGDGFGIAEELQQLGIPVIVIAGRLDAQQMTRIHRIGASGFLARPLSEIALSGTLVSALGKRQREVCAERDTRHATRNMFQSLHSALLLRWMQHLPRSVLEVGLGEVHTASVICELLATGSGSKALPLGALAEGLLTRTVHRHGGRSSGSASRVRCDAVEIPFRMVPTVGYVLAGLAELVCGAVSDARPECVTLDVARRGTNLVARVAAEEGAAFVPPEAEDLRFVRRLVSHLQGRVAVRHAPTLEITAVFPEPREGGRSGG